MQYLVQPLSPHAAHAPLYSGNASRKYAIASAASGLALGATGDGSAVRQGVWSGDKKQQWTFSSDSNGTFRIKNVGNAQSLDVSKGSSSNGAIVQTYAENQTDAQRWRLIEIRNGHFRIENVGSGKALDLDSGNVLGTDADIQQWTWMDNSNQHWILSEIRDATVVAEPVVTVFEGIAYQGRSQKLGVGSYTIDQLTTGGLSSMQVPPGLRVTLYVEFNLRGDFRQVSRDAPSLEISAGSLLIERVATFYDRQNFVGTSFALGVGRHELVQGGLPNDMISSLRVPQGMLVYLFSDTGFKGEFRSYSADQKSMEQMDNKVSSVIIMETGVIVPEHAIRYGDSLSLKTVRGTYLGLDRGAHGGLGSPSALRVERLGPSTHKDLVSFGDIVGLNTPTEGLGLNKNGDGLRSVNHKDGRSTSETNAEKLTLVRAGPSQSLTFLAPGDWVALKTSKGFIVVERDGKLSLVKRDNPPSEAQFLVDRLQEGHAEACGAAVCGEAACFADACGAAACGAAMTLIGVCGVAARGVTICGVDLGGAGFCGAAACGAAAVGFAACGADACNAAACGAAACGAAACGAAACGVDASGAGACALQSTSIGVCGADACGTKAGGIDACGADACGANVCGINLCPVDACAADACALDIIPIIPGI